jgi:hypothetical protein
MKPHHFLKAVDHDSIVAAIAAVEKQTSAEIRVFVSHRKTDDALRAAGHYFTKLKMNETPLRNAVLIFIAPVSHQFAVVVETIFGVKWLRGWSRVSNAETLPKRSCTASQRWVHSLPRIFHRTQPGSTICRTRLLKNDLGEGVAGVTEFGKQNLRKQNSGDRSTPMDAFSGRRCCTATNFNSMIRILTLLFSAFYFPYSATPELL